MRDITQAARAAIDAFQESRNLLLTKSAHAVPGVVIEGFLEAIVEHFEPGLVREAMAGELERRLEYVPAYRARERVRRGARLHDRTHEHLVRLLPDTR